MQNKTNETKGFQTLNIITLSFAHFLHDTFAAFFSPVLPLLIARHGISYSFAGLLKVIHQIPALFNPFIGILADKVSLRYLVIFTPLVTAVAMSMIGVVPHYIYLILVLLVAGISSAMFHVPSPVMTKKIAGNRTGLGMSFYMLGGELARTTGPIVILGAVSVWGFDNSYLLIPVALVATVLIYYRLRNIDVSSEIKKNPPKRGMGSTFRMYLPFFMLLAGFMVLSMLMKSTISTFLPTLLSVDGDSLWTGGIYLSVYQLAGAAGTFTAGTVSDFIGRKKTLVITSVVNPLLMLIFVSVRQTIWAIPLLLAMGYFVIASGSVLLALVQDLNSERPAFINGIYMTINFFISSIAALSMGYVGDIWGLDVAFLTSAFVAFAAIPFLFLIPFPEKNQENT